MKTSSDDCIKLIKKFEGLSLKPYLCPAKIPTIGYGSTKYADGKRVTLADRNITEQEAEELLRTTLKSYENGVNSVVEVELTQNQFDALVDFSYNLGNMAFKESTLLKYINDNNFYMASGEFKRWVKSKGVVLPGLVKRRKAEMDLFLS